MSFIKICDILIIGGIMNDFKNKMNEKIKLYSNKDYLEGYIKNEFLTDDEDADIFLNINSKDELFDSRTIGNQIDLVSDVYDFIEEKSSMLDSDVQIHFHIIGTELDSKEQGSVKHILKEHYAIELYKVQKEYLKIRNKIFKLMGIGAISLLGYLFLYLYTDFEFFLEVFGFLFSFALWEGFDSMLYTLSDIKKEREDITQNLLMNIDFDIEQKI